MLKGILSFGAVAAVALGALALPAQAQRTPLVVYTAMENDQLKAFKDAIEAAVPDVDIQWVRDSTGVITARFLAEKASPKADIVLGLAASSLLLFNKEGLLEKYQPPGTDKLKANFRSADGLFVGMDAFLGVVCYNTVEGGKAGTTMPKAYSDLLDPKLKGKVVMPHPASSGTGYLMVAAWLQTMGNDAGWKFMDGLHENIAVYTHSGSAPCVQAAKGERVIGLGFDMRAAREKSNGAPLEIILPSEGVGWDMEASSIVKGTSKLDADQEGDGLGGLERRQRALFQVLRAGGASRGQQPAAQLSDGRGSQDGQDRSAEDGQRSRGHPHGMDQALRRQVGAEVGEQLAGGALRAAPAGDQR